MNSPTKSKIKVNKTQNRTINKNAVIQAIAPNKKIIIVPSPSF